MSADLSAQLRKMAWALKFEVPKAVADDVEVICTAAADALDAKDARIAELEARVEQLLPHSPGEVTLWFEQVHEMKYHEMCARIAELEAERSQFVKALAEYGWATSQTLDEVAALTAERDALKAELAHMKDACELFADELAWPARWRAIAEDLAAALRGGFHTDLANEIARAALAEFDEAQND